MIADRFRVDGQVAIVTGAGRGIGAATAVALAQAGADVVITSRTQAELDAVAEQVEQAGRRAVALPGDVRDVEHLQRLVDAATGELGRLDIVVNNVGGTLPMPFLDTTEAFLADAFAFNVVTTFALSRRAVPKMLATGGGSIVNITSVMGHLRERGYLAYGTTKAALSHMTRLAAADLSPRIRVNAVAAGATATSALQIVMDNEDLHRQIVDATPLGRLGEPEEIAAAVLYLCAPSGAFITGKILEVDGGTEYPTLKLPLPDLEEGS